MTSNFTLQEITTGSHLWQNVWPPQKLHYSSPAIVMLNALFQPFIICFTYLWFNNAVCSSDYAAL